MADAADAAGAATVVGVATCSTVAGAALACGLAAADFAGAADEAAGAAAKPEDAGESTVPNVAMALRRRESSRMIRLAFHAGPSACLRNEKKKGISEQECKERQRSKRREHHTYNATGNAID